MKPYWIAVNLAKTGLRYAKYKNKGKQELYEDESFSNKKKNNNMQEKVDIDNLDPVLLIGIMECPYCKSFCMHSISMDKNSKEKYIGCHYCKQFTIIPDDTFNALSVVANQTPQDSDFINELFQNAFKWYALNEPKNIISANDFDEIRSKMTVELFNILKSNNEEMSDGFIKRTSEIAFDCYKIAWEKVKEKEEQNKSNKNDTVRSNKMKKSSNESKSKNKKKDSIENIQELYRRARIAYEKKQLDVCIHYYLEISKKNPDDYEPDFYILICDALMTIDNHEKRHSLALSFPTIAKKIFASSDNEETKAENLLKMEKEIIYLQLLFTRYGYNKSKETNDTTALKDAMDDYCFISYSWIPTLINSPFDKYKKYFGDRTIAECIVDHCEVLLKNIAFSSDYIDYEKVKDIIIQYEPDFDFSKYSKIIEDFEKTTSTSTTSSGGCYVATCVYGSYDCPEVWTLRRYRDNNVAKNWYGRLFIKIYYATSPTIIRFFGKTKWFKNMWKPKLDKMVRNLQNSGYKSTPYKDIKW